MDEGELEGAAMEHSGFELIDLRSEIRGQKNSEI
jgi:hypothetical protein